MMTSEQITPGRGGQEVGDLGGCSSGGVQLGLRGGFWVPGVPAGEPAEQTTGNKAGLQHAETQRSSHAGLVSDQTRQEFKPRTAWGQWAAFFSREKVTADRHTYQNGHIHIQMNPRTCMDMHVNIVICTYSVCRQTFLQVQARTHTSSHQLH